MLLEETIWKYYKKRYETILLSYYKKRDDILYINLNTTFRENRERYTVETFLMGQMLVSPLMSFDQYSSMTKYKICQGIRTLGKYCCVLAPLWG